MSKKRCLVTGTTGQTASFLVELLLKDNVEVHGVQRRTSTVTTGRIDKILDNKEIETHYADLADSNSIVRLLTKIKPDMIFNLGSQSHVMVSFDIPIYTADVTGIGPLRILEALRSLGMEKDVRLLQASSSEMYGDSPPPQNEMTRMNPQSPYGAAKLMAFHIVKQYRTGYGMFACNSICFNHSGERRGINFVEQKICHGAAKIKLGLANEIRLGNIDAKRDWGHAKDYSRCQILIMKHSVPDDFVVATEEQHTVREFAERVFKKVGLDFYDYLQFDEQYLRPNEVPSLLGDATKARTVLGWKPEIDFDHLIDLMVNNAMKEEEFEAYKKRKSITG